MTNKLFLALGICLMLYLPTQAQTDTTAPKRYKWEVATDLLWLINKNNIPASSIFVRRHFVTKKGKNVALRMRLGWDLTQAESIGNKNQQPQSAIPAAGTYPGNGTILKPIVFIGLEKQISLEKRIQLFYGFDVGVDLYYEKLNFLASGPAGLYLSRTYTNTRYSLVALGGFKYFLHPRIAISTEINFVSTYRRNRSKTTAVLLTDPTFPPSSIQAGDSNDFYATFNPFYLLNLSLNF